MCQVHTCTYKCTFVHIHTCPLVYLESMCFSYTHAHCAVGVLLHTKGGVCIQEAETIYRRVLEVSHLRRANPLTCPAQKYLPFLHAVHAQWNWILQYKHACTRNLIVLVLCADCSWSLTTRTPQPTWNSSWKSMNPAPSLRKPPHFFTATCLLWPRLGQALAWTWGGMRLLTHWCSSPLITATLSTLPTTPNTIPIHWHWSRFSSMILLQRILSAWLRLCLHESLRQLMRTYPLLWDCSSTTTATAKYSLLLSSPSTTTATAKSRLLLSSPTRKVLSHRCLPHEMIQGMEEAPTHKLAATALALDQALLCLVQLPPAQHQAALAQVLKVRLLWCTPRTTAYLQETFLRCTSCSSSMLHNHHMPHLLTAHTWMDTCQVQEDCL